MTWDSAEGHEPAADRDLPRLIRAGDQEAFGRLFRCHYSRLCAFAERFVDSSDAAEEVVSEVFFRIWKTRRSWNVIGSVRAYLYTAVRNQALKRLDHERLTDRVRATAAVHGVSPGMGSGQSGPDVALDRSELAAVMTRAIDSLPERCRETFVLHRQHGMSYAEIAAIMGVTTKTVENQLARALKLLRERLLDWMA